MRYPRQWLQACILLLALLSLVGCSSGGVQVNLPRSADMVLGSERVVFADRFLRSKIEVSYVGLKPSGDRVKARVQLRSRESLGLNIEYRFVWFDAHGAAVNTEAFAWYPIKFKAKNLITLESLSPHERATQFQLKLRQ